MVDGVVGAGDVVGDLLVGLDVLAWEQLLASPFGHSVLRHDLAGLLDAGDHDLHVMALRIGEVAGIDLRLVTEVLRAQTHGAARLRMSDIRGEAEGVLRGLVALTQGVHIEGHRTVVHHQVGTVEPVLGGGEDADLPPLGGILDHRLLGLPRDDAFRVIAQVLADSRRIHAGLDADLGEVVLRADAREHEQLRGVDRAGGDDDFLLRLDPVGLAEGVVDHEHGRAVVVLVELEFLGLSVGEDCEVLTVKDRVEVGHRGGRPGAVVLAVDLEEVRTVDDGLTLVELHARDAGLLAGVEERDTTGIDRGHIHQTDGAVMAVVVAGQLIVLELLVQAEGVLRTPSGRAVLLFPLVEILTRSPEGDARVVGGAAAEHLGAGMAHVRVAVLLLFDRVVPVVAGFEELHPAVELKDDVLVRVGRAGLEESDGDLGVLAQSGCDRCAGGAAADDDVIKAMSSLHCSSLLVLRYASSDRD